jgi:hypothetical protein
MDHGKRALAVRDRLCWLCGEKAGRYLAFVIGPMCVVNRNTSEPGCHLACAEFAVKACPFLLLPKSRYREAPEGGKILAGALPGNPGACAIYVCTDFKPYQVPGSGDWLIRLGEPSAVSWWSEGKPASRERALEAIQSRLHFLEDIAREEGPEAMYHLGRLVGEACKFLPAE